MDTHTPAPKTAPEDTSGYPFLGRLFHQVDQPGRPKQIFQGLAGLCVLLFGLDFTYDKYGHFAVEYLPGVYGAFGLVMFTVMIFVAKAVRSLLKRPEGYYGDKSVDNEDYPADQLEKVNHNGA